MITKVHSCVAISHSLCHTCTIQISHFPESCTRLSCCTARCWQSDCRTSISSLHAPEKQRCAESGVLRMITQVNTLDPSSVSACTGLCPKATKLCRLGAQSCAYPWEAIVPPPKGGGSGTLLIPPHDLFHSSRATSQPPVVLLSCS